MPDLPPCLRVRTDGSLRLAVHVQPKAKRERVAGLHGDALKLCIAAPPVDGKANEAVIRCVAALFGLARSAVTIDNGESSRDKGIILSGIPAAEAVARLLSLLQR